MAGVAAVELLGVISMTRKPVRLELLGGEPQDLGVVALPSRRVRALAGEPQTVRARHRVTTLTPPRAGNDSASATSDGAIDVHHRPDRLGVDGLARLHEPAEKLAQPAERGRGAAPAARSDST